MVEWLPFQAQSWDEVREGPRYQLTYSRAKQIRNIGFGAYAHGYDGGQTPGIQEIEVCVIGVHDIGCLI